LTPNQRRTPNSAPEVPGVVDFGELSEQLVCRMQIISVIKNALAKPRNCGFKKSRVRRIGMTILGPKYTAEFLR
jgi:hypothetical protein